MPRGRKTSHKGGRKQFSKPEEIERQLKQVNLGDPSDESKEKRESGSESSEEESSDDDQPRRSGVHGLIEIENPNRQVARPKKLKDLTVIEDKSDADDDDDTSKPQLTRKEREEVERQRHKAHMEKLRGEGKTDEARADLARLAIVRAERAAAARKREEEAKIKELTSKSKAPQNPSVAPGAAGSSTTTPSTSKANKFVDDI